MSLHVAICFEFSAINGGENSFLALVPELRCRGIELTVIAPPGGPLAERFQSLKVHVELWGGRRGKTSPTLDSRRADLASAVRRCHPDSVHGNSLNISRLLGPVVTDLQIPSVGHLRDIIKLSARAIHDLGCHRRLLAVSEAARQFHIGQGLPSDRVEVLYNGVDLGRFRPRQPTGYLHRELGIEPEAALLGGIGQIGLRKGWDVAMSAFATIAAWHPNAHLVIVGEQHSRKAETFEYTSGLRAAATAAPLRGRVHFLGRREDVPSLLTELTALVHPARQEPLGRVLLEAAASGVPIVTTDVGGTPEIFPTSAQAALLVQPDAPAALARELSRLLEQPNLRKALGQAARREAERRFQLRPCAAALAKHYSDAFEARLSSEDATPPDHPSSNWD